MSIRSKLQKNMAIKLLVLYSHEIRCKVNERLFSDEQQIMRWYKKTCGKYPDLDNPSTFSEKMQIYKLKCHDPLLTQCADKYGVREYVKKCGCGHLLNEVYAVYDSVDQIDIDKLPDKFVLKATHGSGYNLIVKDKKAVNWFWWKKIMRSWLRQDIYWSGREWAYQNVPRRIIAEKYLEDNSGGLLDYKFYCFNGTPKLMHFDVGRFSGKHLRNFYDMDMNFIPLYGGYDYDPSIPFIDRDIFTRLAKIAEDLCKPFSFARVDLYQNNGTIYFGEITFYPDGGKNVYVPDSYNDWLGSLWDISDLMR